MKTTIAAILIKWLVIITSISTLHCGPRHPPTLQEPTAGDNPSSTGPHKQSLMCGVSRAYPDDSRTLSVTFNGANRRHVVYYVERSGRRLHMASEAADGSWVDTIMPADNVRALCAASTEQGSTVIFVACSVEAATFQDKDCRLVENVDQGAAQVIDDNVDYFAMQRRPDGVLELYSLTRDGELRRRWKNSGPGWSYPQILAENVRAYPLNAGLESSGKIRLVFNRRDRIETILLEGANTPAAIQIEGARINVATEPGTDIQGGPADPARFSYYWIGPVPNGTPVPLRALHTSVNSPSSLYDESSIRDGVQSFVTIQRSGAQSLLVQLNERDLWYVFFSRRAGQWRGEWLVDNVSPDASGVAFAQQWTVTLNPAGTLEVWYVPKTSPARVLYRVDEKSFDPLGAFTWSDARASGLTLQ